MFLLIRDDHKRGMTLQAFSTFKQAQEEFETWLKDYWNADDERDDAGNTPGKCCEIGEAYCLGDHIVIKEIGVDNLDELSIYGGRNDDV